MEQTNSSTGSDVVTLKSPGTLTPGLIDEELQIQKQEIKKVWQLNDRLNERNEALTQDLIRLNENYEKLQKRTEKTLQENNSRILSFEQEISNLRKEIQKLRKARINTFKIPSSWINEDFFIFEEEEEE